MIKIHRNRSPDSKDTRRSITERSEKNARDHQSNDTARLIERAKNEEPLVNYKLFYNQLKDELQELYENFKNLLQNENIGSHLQALIFDKKDAEPIVMVSFMKNTIKALLNLRVEAEQAISKVNYTVPKEQGFSKPSFKPETDYEILLQKAEQEIKQHIRFENQLKLTIEMFQTKYQASEKSKDTTTDIVKQAINEMKGDNLKLVDIIKAKDNEITNLIKTVEHHKELIQSLHMQLLGIQVLEVKLTNLKKKHNREMEEMKKYYEAESANLTKEIHQIHKTLSINLSNDEKIRLMHKELLSYKEFNIKKIHQIEEKLKALSEFAENVDKPGSRTNVPENQKGFVSFSKESSPLHRDMSPIQKDFSPVKKESTLNPREGSQREIYTQGSPKSIKEDDERYNKERLANEEYPNSIAMIQNGRDDIVENVPKRRLNGPEEIKSVQKMRLQKEHMQSLIEKRKKAIQQEINILSLRRSSKLDNEPPESYHRGHLGDNKDLQFNVYYENLLNKLNSLAALNDREKSELDKHSLKLTLRDKDKAISQFGGNQEGTSTTKSKGTLLAKKAETEEDSATKISMNLKPSSSFVKLRSLPKSAKGSRPVVLSSVRA